MQLTARNTQIFPIQTDTVKKGAWKKHDRVETEGKYPKKESSHWGCLD
jgi:hypothetical protein